MYKIVLSCFYDAIVTWCIMYQPRRQDKMLAVHISAKNNWYNCICVFAVCHNDISPKHVLLGSHYILWPDCRIRRWRGRLWSCRRKKGCQASDHSNICKSDTTGYLQGDLRPVSSCVSGNKKLMYLTGSQDITFLNPWGLYASNPNQTISTALPQIQFYIKQHYITSQLCVLQWLLNISNPLSHSLICWAMGSDCPLIVII